jgi:hypothetical protein
VKLSENEGYEAPVPEVIVRATVSHPYMGMVMFEVDVPLPYLMYVTEELPELH